MWKIAAYLQWSLFMKCCCINSTTSVLLIPRTWQITGPLFNVHGTNILNDFMRNDISVVLKHTKMEFTTALTCCNFLRRWASPLNFWSNCTYLLRRAGISLATAKLDRSAHTLILFETLRIGHCERYSRIPSDTACSHPHINTPYLGERDMSSVRNL